MAENKDPDKAPASITEKFKMEPPSGAWNALDADLERRNTTLYRRKADRFRLLSILLAVLLISFISFYYIDNEQQKTAFNTVENSKTVENSNNVTSGHSDPTEIKSKATASNGIVREQTNTNRVKNPGTSSGSIPSENEKSNAPVIGKQSQVFSNSPVPKPENNTVSNGIQSRDLQFANTQPNASKNAYKTEAPLESSELTTSGETQNNPSDKGNLNNHNNADQSSPILAAPVALPVINESNDISTESGNKEVQETNSPSLISEATLAGNQISETTPVAASNGSLKDSVLTSVNQSTSHWSISLFYAPFYSRNRLTDNNSYDAENPSDYNSNEKSLYSFSTGFHLRYHFNERWSIATGAAYSTMVYSIKIPTIYTYKGSDNTVHYQYPTSCGIIEMPNNYGKTLYSGDTIKVNSGCEQTLHFVKIPVLARFTIPVNNFSFYAKAGISANVLIQEKAKVFIWNKEIDIVNNIEGLSKVSYSAMFGIGLEYRIYKRTGIFIEPVYSTAITSLTHDISMNCYPYSFGLNMGASFHF